MATPSRLPRLMVGVPVLVLAVLPEPESCKDKLAKDPAGAWVSSVKLAELAVAVCTLPAASVCVAETLMVPSPRAESSELLKATD